MHNARRIRKRLSVGGVSYLSYVVTGSRMYRFIQIIFSAPWAVLCVLVLRNLPARFKIQITEIRGDRIGHFIGEGAEYVAFTRMNRANGSHLFWIRNSCNDQWNRMLRRELTILNVLKYVDMWDKYCPGKRITSAPSAAVDPRDPNGRFLNSGARISFLENEDAYAHDWLSSRGWNPGDPFICLLVRDAKFTGTRVDYGPPSDSVSKKWANHDYRNSDIETYIPAIQWLLDQGVWVLRMGRVMKRELVFTHARLIDYSFDPAACDLLDIWLFANCSACISTASGPDVLALVYEKPLLRLNALPLALMAISSASTYIPKQLIWNSSQKELSLRENLRFPSQNSAEYASAGISVVDMDANSILSAVIEFWQSAQGNGFGSESEQEIQTRFWQVMESWPDYSRHHPYRNPKFRLGPTWIRQRDESYFELP